MVLQNSDHQKVYRRLKTLPAAEVGQIMRCLSSDDLDELLEQAATSSSAPQSPVGQLAYHPTMRVEALESCPSEPKRAVHALRPRKLPNVARFAHRHRDHDLSKLELNGTSSPLPHTQDLFIDPIGLGYDSDKYQDELVSISSSESTRSVPNWTNELPVQSDPKQPSQDALFPMPRQYDPVKNMFVPAGAGLSL